MGVPAFFKWLTVRYPQIVIDAISEEDLDALRVQYIKENTRRRQNQIDPPSNDQDDFDPTVLIKKKIAENNPSVDCLYLDMNGIIHPCCHPVDKPQPTTEQEMYHLIFEYIDRIISIVQPNKTLYMAIDGVAPRAKMNQQRSRRYRTALDVEEKAQRTASIKNQWAADGIKFDDKNTGESTFDSNVITPGTMFMHNLAKALQLYIIERIHNEPRWARLQVIFSDAFVPGEGEHKILDFIRSQRAQEGYDPNTSHCIYGADADLIMLGLSTHEPHFYVLRESLEQEKDKQCKKCKKKGHYTHECGTDVVNDPDARKRSALVQFQYVKISVVREYLYLEFKDIDIPFKFDFEKVIDDFVFLCFFVGNDFLPHLPSLSIREGALDALVFIYKNLLPSMGGYLSKGSGELNLCNVDILLNDLAKLEEEQFVQHQKNARYNEDRRRREDDKEKWLYEKQVAAKKKAAQLTEQNNEPVVWKNQDKRGPVVTNNAAQNDVEGTAEEIAAYEKKQMKASEFEKEGKKDVFDNIMKSEGLTEEEKMKLAEKKLEEIVKKHQREINDTKVEEYTDRVKLGQIGWKERYYAEKFQIVEEEELKKFRKEIRQAYIEGLSWVFAYYYNGCVSWHWYYPYHYAPFSSDLIGCDSLDIKFDLGEPVKPFEQLLSVFPKQSRHAIPTCYHKLYEADSPIIDFYPSEVRLDINGARYAWMGVNILSFIERPRLLKEMVEADDKEANLTPHERQRNKQFGDIKLFFRENIYNKESALVKEIKANQNTEKTLVASFKTNDTLTGIVQLQDVTKKTGMTANLFPIGEQIDKKMGKFEVKVDSCDTFVVNLAQPEQYIHKTELLPEVKMPKREVEDFAIFHIKRKFFQGEEAIRIVERVLKIDASRDPVYQFGGRTNYSGQQMGSYQNGRSHNAESGVGRGGFQALPQMGVKRRYDEYSANYPQENQESYAQKRLNTGGEQYRQNVYQQQQDFTLNRPQVNYNIPRGGYDNRGGYNNNNSEMRQNYQRQIENANRESGGQNNQLASLLNQFNEVSSQQPGQGVLQAPQLQGSNRFQEQMVLGQQNYQKHLHDQSNNQEQPYEQQNYPAQRGRGGHFNNHRGGRGGRGGYNNHRGGPPHHQGNNYRR